MNLKKDRRPEKRRLNHLLKKCQYGKYVEDCRGHPSVITEQEYYPSDMYGWGFSCRSLVDGTPWSCSISHCGPLPLLKEEAYERAAFIRENGMEAYWVLYYPETGDE